MWMSAIFVVVLFQMQPVILQARDTPILDQAYWNEVGREDLNEALNVKLNTGVARNVIIFIGDGMSAITVAAARIYRAGESSNLVWEKFDHVGLLKTYCNDKMVPDSSVTASAMMTGIKGNKGTLGTDGSVKLEDCKASLDQNTWTTSTAVFAQAAGKSTGVVTNTRITHATPGSVYAHSAHRDWECNAALPDDAKECKDIARQLIEDEPGRNLNVIMGGGRQMLVSDQVSYSNDQIDMTTCRRNDSRNLINEWIERQQSMSAKYAYVNNTGGLKNLDTDKVDNLLGIFANSHFPFNYLRDKSDAGPPSVELMATTAVKILSKNPKGFFLMVEGGEIDLGHHRGRAKVALDETIQLHFAVKATVDLLEELGIKDETLVIVTSDHGHSLTINGYPGRGTNILGIADKSKVDQANYTTLMYAMSGRENFQFEVVDGQVKRRDPSRDDTTSWDYHQQATVVNDENKHEGGDVNVYAIGPMAHLFHNVHEQSYVAHVIQYAARLGRYADRNVNSSTVPLASCALMLWAFLGIRFL